MRRITIRLTDEEYAELERRAAEDRRTVRQMAERLVTLQEPVHIRADWTWRPQPYLPTWQPLISSPNTSGFDATVTNGMSALRHV